MLLCGGITLILWKKRRRQRLDRQGENGADNGRNGESELPVYEFNVIAHATNDFSHENKLGEGGFGIVYKGVLHDGQEIAVKRLSKESSQGLDELKIEVVFITMLQHRNLVKLAGYCIEKEERMLIYDYMPNKSLDFFIFWPRQYELLEHLVTCPLSILLILEIRSEYWSLRSLAEKNRGFSHPGHHHNLLGHAWILFGEGEALDLADPFIRNATYASEMQRAIHIGLLCVQQHPEDRPSMLQVAVMLNSDSELPEPKEPGFYVERNCQPLELVLGNTDY